MVDVDVEILDYKLNSIFSYLRSLVQKLSTSEQIRERALYERHACWDVFLFNSNVAQDGILRYASR